MFTKREANFCKGIAIILMLFHHLFDDYGEYEGYLVNFFPFNAERVHFFALLARLCVSIFVFISGYGIAAAYRERFSERKPGKQEIFSFTWNRLWKLMTGYWFVFLLTLICQPLGRTIFDAYGTSLKEIAAYGLIDVLGLAYMFGTPTLNPTWWYMTMAITIVVIMPVVMRVIDKFGTFILLAGSLLIFNMFGANTLFTYYAFSMLLGAVCFEKDFFRWLDKVWKEKRYGILLKALLELVLILVLISYRTNFSYYGIVDGLIAMAVAMFVSTVLIHIPFITNVMQALGKHSANMFLTHNQIYAYYFLGFFYSLKHWLVILGCLTVVCVIVSIGVEAVKKYTGYQRVMERMGKKIIGE